MRDLSIVLIEEIEKSSDNSSGVSGLLLKRIDVLRSMLRLDNTVGVSSPSYSIINSIVMGSYDDRGNGKNKYKEHRGLITLIRRLNSSLGSCLDIMDDSLYKFKDVLETFESDNEGVIKYVGKELGLIEKYIPVILQIGDKGLDYIRVFDKDKLKKLVVGLESLENKLSIWYRKLVVNTDNLKKSGVDSNVDVSKIRLLVVNNVKSYWDQHMKEMEKIVNTAIRKHKFLNVVKDVMLKHLIASSKLVGKLNFDSMYGRKGSSYTFNARDDRSDMRVIYKDGNSFISMYYPMGLDCVLVYDKKPVSLTIDTVLSIYYHDEKNGGNYIDDSFKATTTVKF